MLGKHSFFALLLSLLSASVVLSQLSYDSYVMDHQRRTIELVFADDGQSPAVKTASTVEMSVNLYVESEVKIEIRNALGRKLFESMAIYPEGDQRIRVKIGHMEDGVYFVRVSTALESEVEMVVLER